ncbi:hypothetical protein D7M10_00755 [Pseudomonas fluorescens]|nr:hypothetical protein D7M10_00755 [Pseudomonas fluorescens]
MSYKPVEIKRGACVGAGLCGSWLACDGITSVSLTHRGDAIAGKPAPTQTVFLQGVGQPYWAPLTAPSLPSTPPINCSTVIFWPLKVTSLLA